MEEAGFSKTSENILESTRRHMPQDLDIKE